MTPERDPIRDAGTVMLELPRGHVEVDFTSPAGERIAAVIMGRWQMREVESNEIAHARPATKHAL